MQIQIASCQNRLHFSIKSRVLASVSALTVEIMEMLLDSFDALARLMLKSDM